MLKISDKTLDSIQKDVTSNPALMRPYQQAVARVMSQFNDWVLKQCRAYCIQHGMGAKDDEGVLQLMETFQLLNLHDTKFILFDNKGVYICCWTEPTFTPKHLEASDTEFVGVDQIRIDYAYGSSCPWEPPAGALNPIHIAPITPTEG